MTNGTRLAAGFGLVALVGVLANWLGADGIQADVLGRAEAALAGTGAGWARVEIDGRDVTLLGRAPDEASRSAVIAALADSWGVRSVADRTTVVPLASPFVWTAVKPAPRITIAGSVPSAEAEAALAADARLAFGEEIEDDAEIARGAPAGDWTAVARSALEQMAKISHGEAELKDKALTIRGTAPSVAAASAVRTALIRGLPEGFTATVDLATPKPAPVEPLASASACQSALDAQAVAPDPWFEPGGPFLDPKGYARLDRVAVLARRCAAYGLEIVGTTDETGDPVRDAAIGRIQAMTVRDYLVASGAKDAAITAKGAALAAPAKGDGKSDTARLPRRGIAITVLAQDGS